MNHVLECKQCGGQLNPEEGQKIIYCKFCGSANAISVTDRFDLYNRANYLRRKNEFDRALGIYEDIIKEDPTDAEGYYGIALCKYGIEYVDDPISLKKIPTCHRTRYRLISQDDDFQKAIQYADPDTAEIYLDEAKQIDNILKKIQQISSKQEKYEIFICYKESDEQGNRTNTSVLAQDIYEKLTEKGYRVFFARKTLENKLGSDYEPIIFSALYSSKIMLVVGTNPNEFQAVWVRNEWVRYMERISNGDECTLIPVFKDISPYDLPVEMANIQALDMSKIGFMQDLSDGVAKIIKRPLAQNEVIYQTDSTNGVHGSNSANGLIKRAYLFLEQGDFQNADAYFERALDINPESSQCYWGKLLCQLNLKTEEELQNLEIRISGIKDYDMAVRFANDEQKEAYKKYADYLDMKCYEIEERKRKEEEEKQKKELEDIAEKNRIADEKRLEWIKKRNRWLKVWCIAGIFFVFILVCNWIWDGTAFDAKYAYYEEGAQRYRHLDFSDDHKATTYAGDYDPLTIKMNRSEYPYCKFGNTVYIYLSFRPDLLDRLSKFIIDEENQTITEDRVGAVTYYKQ